MFILRRLKVDSSVKAEIRSSIYSSSKSSQAVIIDGRSVARSLLNEVGHKVNKWVRAGLRPPSLTAVLVGDNPASSSYIKIKKKAALKIGIKVDLVKLPADISEGSLLQEVQKLNDDPKVDGILIQLPLPFHINERRVCNAVFPIKDVDGFNSVNIGKLCLNVHGMIPCTALAVCHLLKSCGFDMKGKHAVVCGRSKNVGLPIALLLHSGGSGYAKGLNITTTVCHRYTPRDQLCSLMKSADIVVSATGVPDLIRGHMIKEGACVIDVGFTRIKDESNDSELIVGDVNFEEVSQVAGYITPVPGGVGPVTVAALMDNTMQAATNISSSSYFR